MPLETEMPAPVTTKALFDVIKALRISGLKASSALKIISCILNGEILLVNQQNK
jgi:hypothetical protein